jgi:DNA-binding beta-propeller fold protein YncE
LLVVVVGVGAIAALAAWAVRGFTSPAASSTVVRAETRHAPVSHPRRRIRVVEHVTGTLSQPIRDAAVAPLGGAVMLLGGLTSSDVSRSDVRIASPAADRGAGRLPTALHDTAAVRIGGEVYLFGGGTGANTQSDAIVRIPTGGGGAVDVGRLPAPSSDQSAATIHGTAYVVGGYTGTHWLDTIVAWRPGRPARVVAHLPFALRYAAVCAAGDRLVIAGGSRESGNAGSEVLSYRPGSSRVVRIGKLPAPTTHAAAAGLGNVAYVIGGRGSALGSASARIVAIDPRAHRIWTVGRLDSPRSDLAAATLGRRIVLVGGLGTTGTEARISKLTARAVRAGAKPATSPEDVYASDRANRLTGAARFARQLVYVPNSDSDTVDVIDPHTFRIVEHFAVGGLPQHVVPAWDLKTLYVTNDTGNSLTPIDPRTGRPGAPIRVDDPYNLYFTPDGRYAIVVAERLQRLDFRDPHNFRLRHALVVPCRGVDHMDFSADGRFLLASCEFSGQMLVVDVARQRVVRTITLPDGSAGMPQDVKLSPDGRVYYVADLRAGGVWEIGAHSYRVLGFLHTGSGAHGLYPSRDAKLLYVSNRNVGTISVISFRARRIVATWRIPGGSPDMGGVSADGRVLWLSGRYSGEVYAISTRTGRLLARIPVGSGPHGVCVWPQPGVYSLGHTGILR